MTKPTDSKVPAAFQAMLAFLLRLLDRGMLHAPPPDVVKGNEHALAGHRAAVEVNAECFTGRHLNRLFCLVQAAADEHAGSAAGNPFAVIKDRQRLANEPPLADAALDVGRLREDRAWLIGEVERLRERASNGTFEDEYACVNRAIFEVIGRELHGCEEIADALKAWARSDRTATQVLDPAFDRLAAAVEALRVTLGSVIEVAEAFDAYAASRATLTGTATTAEQVTFTRLEGETPEAFRARITLHLNGMGSTPFVLPGQDGNREVLGQIVYRVRRQWADEGSTGRYSFTRWADRTAAERDLDCRIGVALATVGQGYAGAIDAPVLTEEAAQKWADDVVDSCEDGTENPDEMIREALLAAARGEYPTT
jgi:hypothetical protein